MTDTHLPSQQQNAGAPSHPGLVRGLLVGTAVVFILLAFLGSPGGLGMEAWGPLLVLIMAISMFVAFMRAAFTLTAFRGTTGVKVGAALLLGAFVAMTGT